MLVPVGNEFAKVDDEDYERVFSRAKWHVDYKGYARGIPRIGKVGCKRGVVRDRLSAERMHRFIMNAPNNVEVDHIDGDRLNNQKYNLRFANDAQNAQNRRAPTKGVHRLPSGRWRARLANRSTNRSLGCFATKEEAQIAWDKAALEEYGEFAKLNERAQ